VLERVRERLDDDLDTPGAVSVIDEASALGLDVRDSANLLGVVL
jgi:L-cysteine:1D-myo-inositol 2-amino-2-deoxy-alpha-D-glucopyranoside ligase